MTPPNEKAGSPAYPKVGDTGLVNKDDACMNWIRRAQIVHVSQGDTELWGFLDLDTGREVYTNEKFTFYKDAAP